MPKGSLFDEVGSTPPARDELELTFIGPGYGECALAHVGNGGWVIFDSCKLPGRSRAAPLEYLQKIGSDPAAVFAIVVSHWDDDHCRGLAEMVSACVEADIVMASSFVEKDFLAFVAAHSSPLTQSFRSGVKEIREVMHTLDATGRGLKVASPARRLYSPADFSSSQPSPIEVWSLSPSDQELINFVAWVAEKMPGVGETRRVAIPRKRNDLSVVIHLSVGADVMLFGGDLEEEGEPATGWSAILGLSGRPTTKAQVFKVAHHGSRTGHHPSVPTNLLEVEPLAVVAPFKNGNRSIPTADDVAIIRGFAPQSFSTSTLKARSSPKRDLAVEKTIAEVTSHFTTIKRSDGLIRLRKKLNTSGAWQIEKFGTACDLAYAL